MLDRLSSKSTATRWLLMTRTPFPSALIYIISPETHMNTFLETLEVWSVTIVSQAFRSCQPVLICDVNNITDEGQPFGTRWKITKGSQSESGDQPEDKASEEGHSEEVGRAVAASAEYPSKISDSHEKRW